MANHPSNYRNENKMQIQKFQRKPFSVEGVKVTEENLEEVAQWCLGAVEENPKTNKKHIRVDAHRPLTERQTMAIPGDWVLFYNRGFKVYTESAFSRNFELIEAGTGSDHADFVMEDSMQTVLPINLIEAEAIMHEAAEKMREVAKKHRALVPTTEDGNPHRA